MEWCSHRRATCWPRWWHNSCVFLSRFVLPPPGLGPAGVLCLDIWIRELSASAAMCVVGCFFVLCMSFCCLVFQSGGVRWTDSVIQ